MKRGAVERGERGWFGGSAKRGGAKGGSGERGSWKEEKGALGESRRVEGEGCAEGQGGKEEGEVNDNWRRCLLW